MLWAEVMTDPAPLLKIEDLSFRYTKKSEPVFSKLHLTLNRGESALLMGPSGSGKSSLAYCIAGLYPRYAGVLEGQIQFAGESVQQMPSSQRAQHISILFQNPDDQFCMDRVDREILFALENINYQGDLAQRVEELLEWVGLEGLQDQSLHHLSGGTKQKVALATALATGAQLLILDEPFANLDPESCELVLESLKKLQRRGLAFLIVDHKPNWWKDLVQRVLVLDAKGQIAKDSILPDQLPQHRDLFQSLGLYLDDQWLQEYSPLKPNSDLPPAIVAENLTLYRGNRVLQENLSFQIPSGAITSLIGKNGVGKTTLLETIAGIHKPKGGLVLSGKPGLVFQNPRFQFIKLNVMEDVMATLEASGSQESESSLRARALMLLDEFGLKGSENLSPYQLSQGQQRRLALLSMLAGNASILLLDEPTYAQDEKSTRTILRLLQDRVKSGLTVIMATHDLSLAHAISSKVLWMDKEGLTPTMEHLEIQMKEACPCAD